MLIKLWSFKWSWDIYYSILSSQIEHKTWNFFLHLLSMQTLLILSKEWSPFSVQFTYDLKINYFPSIYFYQLKIFIFLIFKFYDKNIKYFLLYRYIIYNKNYKKKYITLLLII